MLPSLLNGKSRLLTRGRLLSFLSVDALEERNLLSVGPTLINEVEQNDTILTAENFGALTINGLVEGNGTIGNGAAGGADVDFYRFSLNEASRVALDLAGAGGSSLEGVLSLYREDPFSLAGFQRITQQSEVGVGGAANLEIDLAAGTYFVAASGSGNEHYHPFLANSGYHGSTGDYQLTIETSDLGIQFGDGPRILNANPSQDAVLDRSPLSLRLGVSADLQQATLIPGLTVNLLSSPDATFGDFNDVPVFVLSANYSPVTREVVIAPFAPLAPGFYQLTLAGDANVNFFTVQGLDASPLGLSAANPHGQDFVLSFEINGSEGVASTVPQADDTDATARDLGDVTDAGFIQVTGAIGDDPSDFFPFNPSDVDIFRFTVTGPGRYSLTAEAFAGRIGSSLDSALTLFGRQDPADPFSPLVFLASNDSTSNLTLAENFTAPLFSDPALYAGLTEGEYYLAVSSAFNFPDDFFPPGTAGIFDPTISHSGFSGFTTGEYVLNVLVEPSPEAPQVEASSIAANAILQGPPVTFTVEFSGTMNLQQLSFEAYQKTFFGALSAVFIEDDLGQRFFPRLQSYDEATNVATFFLLDSLPQGDLELHLAGHPPFGETGVTDLAGNPLVGNQAGDPTGDYVIPFTVAGAPRGSVGNPLLWLGEEPNDSLAGAQVIGPLFPNELVFGVTIERAPSGASADTDDFLLIELPQPQAYLFSLTDTSGLPGGTLPLITDVNGTPAPTIPQGPNAVLATLPAGQYVVQVGGWSAGAAPTVAYQLHVSMLGAPEKATPLTVGPAPALQIRLAGGNLAPSNDSNGVPQVFLPPIGSGATILQVAAPFGSGIDPATFLVNGGASGIPTRSFGPLGAGPLGGSFGISGPASTGSLNVVLGPGMTPLPDFSLPLASLFNLFTQGPDGDEATPDKPKDDAPTDDNPNIATPDKVMPDDAANAPGVGDPDGSDALREFLMQLMSDLGDWTLDSQEYLRSLFDSRHVQPDAAEELRIVPGTSSRRRDFGDPFAAARDDDGEHEAAAVMGVMAFALASGRSKKRGSGKKR